MKDIPPIDQEQKPWEIDQTGPAATDPHKIFSIDLLKIFKWFKQKKEKSNVQDF